MDKLKFAIHRADRVQRFLEQQETKDALHDIEQDIIGLWTQSKTEEKETREDLYRELWGLRALKARFKRWINEGVKAREELEYQDKLKGKK